MRKPLNLATTLSLLLIAACSSENRPTQPTSVVKSDISVITEAAPTIVNNPIPALPNLPPVSIDPPVNPAPVGRPFNRTDCDYSNPSAIRCYNPSSSPITITGAMNAIDCGKTYGKQTVTIFPLSNGYFTLPRPGCNEKGQGDFFFGVNEGSCKNPDFTSQVVYDGGACAPIITTPPVSCVPKWDDPEFVEFIDNSNKSVPDACTNHTFVRTLSDGCGNTKKEEKVVCY